MNCPKCGGKARTVDTRPILEANQNKRKKRCTLCGYDFITFELTAVDLAKLNR